MSEPVWRVWYDGGRVFSSEDTAWGDLPADGVQHVAVYLGPGRRDMAGCDYYFKAGEVIGANNDNPGDIAKRYPGASIKRGRYTTDEELERIQVEARKS